MAYNFPNPPERRQVFLRDLSGGENVADAPTEVADNQCCLLRNVLWRDGVIRSRPGTRAISISNSNAVPPGVKVLSAFKEVWHGKIFLLTDRSPTLGGGTISVFTLSTRKWEDIYTVPSAAGAHLGSWFLFGENLYYKGVNIYLEISYEAGTDTVTAKSVRAFVPTIMINADNAGVGDLYQPENRLSSEKEAWFNMSDGSHIEEFAANGTSTSVYLNYDGTDLQWWDRMLLRVDEVYVGAKLYKQVPSPTEYDEYSADIETGTITFAVAPGAGLKVRVRYTVTNNLYKIPLSRESDPNAKILSVTVGETEYEEDTIGTQGPPASGFFRVYTPSPDSTGDRWGIFLPPDAIGKYGQADWNSNRIRVRYESENTEAMSAINGCHICGTYGAVGVEKNCIVMAGLGRQPNAFFWSGYDQNGANPGYFPIENYNLAGEYSDPITGFGRQQNRLVIFQENRISSAEYTFTELRGRLAVSLNVKTINDHIGCDLPSTIQLVNNNLVWCNTRLGVMYLKDSTYAYDTLVVSISRNVDNELLPVFRASGGGLRSFDINGKYCVTPFWRDQTPPNSFVWDYGIRGYTADTRNLSWWPQTNLKAVEWVADKNKVYGISGSSMGSPNGSYVFEFEDNLYSDYTPEGGESVVFLRRIDSKMLNFGSYSAQKNVVKLILSMPCDRLVRGAVSYTTDYVSKRQDRTLLDNQYEYDTRAESGVPAVRVRAPKCLHVHHFQFSLLSLDVADMGLISAQVFYEFRAPLKAGVRM